MKVFITDKSFPSYDVFEAKIRETGGVPVFASGKDEATLIAEGSDADIVVNSFAEVTAGFIRSLKHCSLNLRTGIGVNTIDVEAATAQGIRVSYVPDYCRDEVADHTVALALAVARKVCCLDHLIRIGEWTTVGGLSARAGRVPRLSGSVFGLLGFGGIAQRVARRMLAFGLKVVAYDPYLQDEAFKAAGVTRAATQDEVFAQADILSLNLPLTHETKHVVNREAIRKMKDHVFIINTARGPLVDEEALLEALRSGKVCGAGIDVFEEERRLLFQGFSARAGGQEPGRGAARPARGAGPHPVQQGGPRPLRRTSAIRKIKLIRRFYYGIHTLEK
jgi:D-3-phosphoglycerate dehydrogenase